MITQHAGRHSRSSVFVSSRFLSAAMALFIGLLMISTVGFSQSVSTHNGAHDYRHNMGFPCH